MILPVLRILGKVPDSIKKLKKPARCLEIEGEHFLSTDMDMSLALSFWKLLIVFSISSLSQGIRNILPETRLSK